MSDSKIKVFNTTGPCNPDEHYMLPVLSRIPDIDKMIYGKYYFIIHAPRQSGKTTFLKALTNKINSEGQMYALYSSLETLQDITDIDRAICEMFAEILADLNLSGISSFIKFAKEYMQRPESSSVTKIRYLLTDLCVTLDKDLVIFFDEADCISAEALIPFLRQIRIGYNNRKDNASSRFPNSLALVGMRDIRDYIYRIRSESESKGSASPFNIKKRALTLSNFTQDEISSLYNQHTEASGQVFEPKAIERAWFWTKGQPWLVNALAYETVEEILKNDYSVPITNRLIDQAAETLIKKRYTHIDSLLERLKEPRVIQVMDSVFAGTYSQTPPSSDDRQYCLDLGLVVEDNNHNLRPANPIYAEVMSRVISDELQQGLKSSLNQAIANLRWTDGQQLFMSALLKEFQNFWCKNSESFPKRLSNYAAYKLDEATYAFMLLTFLQRVVNSEAKVDREYSEGRGAVDICVTYNKREYIIEVKLKGEDTVDNSITQLAAYLQHNREIEGWIVFFDRNREISWDDKLTWNTVKYDGRTIHLVGC